MYIPKTVIAALAIVGAIVLGWVARDLLERAVSAAPAAAMSGPIVGAAPAGPDTAPPPGGPSPVGATAPITPLGGTTNVYLTIVSPSGTTTNPAGAPTRAVMPQPTPDAVAVGVHAPARSKPIAPGRPTVRPAAAAASAPAPGGPARRTPGSGRTIASAPRATGAANGPGVHVTPGLATAIGEHIVIAQDGSIVYVGDNGYVIANTGDAVQGGVVALDSQSSTFSTQSDQRAVIVAGGGSQTRAGSSAGTSATGRGSAPLTTSRVATTPGVLAGGSPTQVPMDMSPLASAFGLYTLNRTADIAGFEDHSVLVRGLGNVVTYDDSNVFMNRDGKINANTGDTDSAGLNAVAVLRSTVSAGPHCDDGCDDESIIQARAGVFDEGDVAIDGNGNVVWAPDAADESSNDDDSDDDSLPGDNGDDSDAVDDESPDGDVSDPAEPAETREQAGTTRQAADNGEDPVGRPADGSLTVGGDGIDDLSERVDGVGNISTYDDSNVVVGGAGDVNAQIGDSDTGGTVVMDVVDSTVSGGNSR